MVRADRTRRYDKVAPGVVVETVMPSPRQADVCVAEPVRLNAAFRPARAGRLQREVSSRPMILRMLSSSKVESLADAGVNVSVAHSHSREGQAEGREEGQAGTIRSKPGRSRPSEIRHDGDQR